MNLPKNIPKDLSELLQVMATDFPAILSGNLVGIYLWGSLTYEAFDESCSDVDCIGVTRRDLDDREFSELDEWFKNKGENNRWVRRIDMRFVIDHEFLDKRSRCCGFYHYTGKLVRSWIGWKPHHLDEYWEVRHYAVGPEREDDRAAGVPPMPH